MRARLRGFELNELGREQMHFIDQRNAWGNIMLKDAHFSTMHSIDQSMALLIFFSGNAI